MTSKRERNRQEAGNIKRLTTKIDKLNNNKMNQTVRGDS
jgi:hypothetical protein